MMMELCCSIAVRVIRKWQWDHNILNHTLSTAMTIYMHDIVALEWDNHTLQNENSRLHSECEQLKMEIQTLTNENAHLIKEAGIYG